MVRVGEFNNLQVLRKVEIGAYMDDGGDGILLPKRFAPKTLKAGDVINVFVYYDSDNRLIATTQQPKAVAGDIALLKVVSLSPHGAFLDWGLMKDLFIAKSQQLSVMHVGGHYLVKVYIDKQTGRIAATERIEQYLSNDDLTVNENEEVDLVVYRRTDIGYAVIINNEHTGMLYFNEVFSDLAPGDKLKGFIRKIREDNKIDVVAGKRGYDKVEGETDKILRLLKENSGYLPYYDKSDPEEIYSFFGMSKKTFKMATGNLFKQHKIEFTQSGIKLIEE
ncbi:MAG: RNA-binding protein [Filimonas sp.]|nr:RNA-binding protein [Filimonas sp.]